MDHEPTGECASGVVCGRDGGGGRIAPPWAMGGARDVLAAVSAGSGGGATPSPELSDAQKIAFSHARLNRAEFEAKYVMALHAIRDGEWSVPTDAWVVHMVVLAGYFDKEFQARVRTGLQAAIRWRQLVLARRESGVERVGG